MFNSFKKTNPNYHYSQNDLGYQLCDNGGKCEVDTFVEQVNEGMVIDIYRWQNRNAHMIDDATICLWYPKGKRPPFAHKRNN